VVEHLAFTDNKQRRVGAKRQALRDIARGEYVAFVDDDDDIADDYIAELLKAIERKPDVVCFMQRAIIDGVQGIVDFDLIKHRTDAPWQPCPAITARRPWHVCAWRRELAIQGIFPEIDYGEDLQWLNQVHHLARTQVKIDKILHTYRHNATTTEAPPPGASTLKQ
jgi:glycosyltransferase involved in cell wall biosynthesis